MSDGLPGSPFGLGLALVANIAGYITHDRVCLWMGVVGLVAVAVGLVMDVIAQRRGRTWSERDSTRRLC